MSDAYDHISLVVQDVLGWDSAEESLPGSRVKSTVLSPDKKHFVFKEPKERRGAQIWSELVASFIAGDVLGWPVQTTQVGVQGDRVGTLHEYIYDPGYEEMTEGYRFCADCDLDFDFEKGTRHTLPLLEVVAGELATASQPLPDEDFYAYWARALAFDTLISNVDRHAENWAVIYSFGDARMAPLYDNGSSLGCGVDAKGLQKWFHEAGGINEAKLLAFENGGRHHVRAREPSSKGGRFTEVNEAFLQLHPSQRTVFEECAELDLEPIARLCDEIKNVRAIPEEFLMTDQRARHMLSVLQAGRNRVRRLL